MTDLRELLSFRTPITARTWSDLGHVVGQVELSGVILGGADVDPSSTVRAERARVVGDLYFPRPLWPSVPRFAAAHPWVTAHRVESLADVPALIEHGEAPGDGWTTCAAGHRHWGRAGAAGLLIYRHRRGVVEVLLQRRSAATQHGGTWGLPGGALQAGETPIDGALREACEELGLRATDLRIGSARLLPEVISYTDHHGGWAYTTVLATPAGVLDPANLRLDRESDEAAWLPVSPLGEGIRLHPGLAETLPALLELVRGQDLAELHAALFGAPITAVTK